MLRMIVDLFKAQVLSLLPARANKPGFVVGKTASVLTGIGLGSLFNIYTYNLLPTTSRKFAYADDLALLHSSGNWKDLEGTLSQDMTTLSANIQI